VGEFSLYLIVDATGPVAVQSSARLCMLVVGVHARQLRHGTARRRPAGTSQASDKIANSGLLAFALRVCVFSLYLIVNATGPVAVRATGLTLQAASFLFLDFNC
jgi:hypothetical protein